MDYQAQVSALSQDVNNAKNILIVLPSDVTVDQLAAGLALHSSLEQAGKKSTVVTEGIIKVGHSNLFGVGMVQGKLPQTSGGDLTIVLGGVVTPDGTLPIEKMDYYPTGSDLNLIFKALPGKKFEPTHITPKYDAGGVDLVFVVGAQNYEALGQIYTNGKQLFDSSKVVNIDNKQNAQFGTVNLVDPNASSVSEVMYKLLAVLKVGIDADAATNILAGIFSATSDLTGVNVGPDTYEVVSLAMKSGGKKPQPPVAQPQPQFQAAFSQPPQPAPAQAEPAPQPTIDLSKIFNIQPQSQPTSVSEDFTVPQVVSNQPANEIPAQQEETPQGERVSSSNPEIDWLTPKIYTTKG